MTPAQLVLAIHCHQPVGNFDAVFARAHDRAYRPLLDALGRHPHVRIALHLSGPLLDWLEEKRPEFLADVRSLLDRGQVELLGGGLEEPILSAIPDRDALGQLEGLSARIQQLFGAQPRGAWLAERVWEPDLPRLLAPSGLRYTFLDDAHFRAAGVEGPLRGHYVTDHAGTPLALFPIDRGLRERIPYAPVAEALAYLREAAKSGGTLVFGDDGEKFGLWPGTDRWVHEKGWLDAFFKGLGELAGELELLPPSEVLARSAPAGRVYLPSSSYRELMTWTLPASRARRVEAAREELGEDAELLRGGGWSAFFTKYPEAHALQARMLHASTKVAEALAETGETERLALARRELYRGQCNCAYWHGVFGGLYLPHLRHAAYAALIRADNLVDSETRGDGDFIEYEEDDLDADLRDEALLANAQLAAWVDPDEGGALYELDFRPLATCVTHVPARREEAYHAELRVLDQQEPQPQVTPDDQPPPSIHAAPRAKEPGLSKLLVDDGYRRLSFIDRIHAPGFGLEQLQKGSDGDVGHFAGQPYTIEASGVDEEGDLSASVTLVREAGLDLPDGPRRLLIEKTFHVPIDAPRLETEYILENLSDAPLSFTFAPELNLTLLSALEPDRYLELPDGKRASLAARLNHGATKAARLMDEQQGVAIDLELDREAELWTYPVETANLSDEGFERTYQGTCLLLRMPISLPPRESARIIVRTELAKVEIEAESEAAPEPEPEAAPESEPEAPPEPEPTEQ